MLIDTHSHIYSTEFEPDTSAVMDRALQEGVGQILLPAIDAATHIAMLELEAAHKGVCLSMMGLHPCSVKADFEQELRIAEEYLARRRFVAIGETGLDFYWDVTFKEEQYTAFRRQIEWALHFDVPVVIHSRNSTDECIDVVAEFQKGNLRGVFHCFSGNMEQANRVVDLGFYLGIGGVVTFKNSGLDRVVQQLPLEYMILETDAPYLAPVPFRGKRNEPSYIKYVVTKLAAIKEMEEQVIAAATTTNAKKLFGI